MLNIEEQYEHYNFYVDNCTEDELPIDFKTWEQEYLPTLKEIYKDEK